MNQIIRLPLLLISLSAFFYCCAPSLVLLSPTDTDAQRAEASWGGGMNLEKLNIGHKIYINKCGTCHYLYRPYQVSKNKWVEILPSMQDEAKLDAKQFDLLEKYVLTMCEVNPPKKPGK